MTISRLSISFTTKVFFSSWLSVFVLRFSGMIEYPSISPMTYFFFGIFTLPFVLIFLCLLLPMNSRVGHSEHPFRFQYDHAAYGSRYVLILLLSVSYVVLIAIDKIFIGGVLDAGVTVARYAAMESGPRNSLLGALSYFLSGAPPILACFLLTRRARGERKEIIPWLLVLGGFSASFLSGGRNAFVIGAIFILFYALLVRIKQGRTEAPKKLKIPRWLKLCVGFGVVYVVYLFVERAEIRGVDMAGAMQLLSENYGVKVYSPSWLSGFFLEAYYCLVYLVFYLTHAPTYVSQYLEVSYSPMLSGSYGFSILFRIMEVVFGSGSLLDPADELLVSGAYLTLPGTLYVDFGWFGVVFGGLFLSVVTVYIVSLALKSVPGKGLMCASLCLTIIALSPLFSAIAVGNGLPILFLLFLMNVINMGGKFSSGKIGN